MPILVYKLLLTPLLIIAITCATRRWGPVIGGCLIALPISGGPITFFITVEQGLSFGAGVAASNVLGMSAVAVFCFTYLHTIRFGWVAAALAAPAAFFLAVKILSYVSLGVLPSSALAAAIFTFTFLSGGKRQGQAVAYRAPWWDIPFRIVAATGLLLAITEAASHMGPGLSGLLGVFPVFTLVITMFTHKQYGGDTARQMMLGIVFGCYGSLAFFTIVALTLRSLGLGLSYLAASAVCMSLSLLLMRLVSARPGR